MAVTPKPASTVILMDKQDRVYLTKRPKTMKFLGGFFVFPGGAVDKEDNVPKCEYIKNWDSNASLNHADFIAAARELFEEVGVLIARKDDGSSVQLEHEKALEYRRLLVQRKMSFVQLLQQERLYLNLESLTYFGCFTTPEDNPYRFETRFFLAQLPEGQSPEPDNYEIEEAFWTTPSEALLAYEKGELPMVPPTILSLRTILNYQNGAPLMLPVIEDKDLQILRSKMMKQ
ncbi:hypothetical protein DCC39_04315 [Pueribacillus theae]|uniref:Nudix hydrolase domain-containing protein n=1 Tax=Pueribacillus theae TaxID=2171751 RepID=A0A2U1K6Z9_9BACI|nr:NUDIX hydrolase [Pueribacillus theae]PWA12668.1 hypothetical protein DCC39_04315 [Pueribacillus theae]